MCKSLFEDILKHHHLGFLTFNFHCLLPLPKDVQGFGSLEKINALKFENRLQEIKKIIERESICNWTYHRQVEMSLKSIATMQEGADSMTSEF